jgi:UV excision repair protein RAD23
MKITIRTLQNTTFPVEGVESADTVLALKQKISTIKPESAVERQKLIHSGRILVDDKSLSSYDIKDGDFIVMMITKPPPSQPAPQATQSPQPAKESKLKSPAPIPSSSAPSEEFKSAVGRITEMGFDNEEATRALKAAFMNVDRAVEYLTSGNIPEASPQEGDGASSSHVLLPAELEALKNSPQFQQLRAAVQQNPDLIYDILEQIEATNPQLLDMIENNRAAFYKLLTDMEYPGDEAFEQGELGEEVEEGIDEDNTEGGELQRDEAEQQMFDAAVMEQLQASPNDSLAINRIMEMGFDRESAIEAYFACDKNEELAINFLLNNANQN